MGIHGRMLVLSLLLSGVASAAPPDPAPELLDEVVVEAPKEAEITAFVGQALPDQDTRQLALWHSPLCMAIRGMAPPQANRFIAGVQQVTKLGSLGPAAKGCKPNVIIILIDQPNMLVDRMLERYGHLFRPASTDDVRRDLGGSEPVRIWYASVKTNAYSAAVDQQDEFGNVNSRAKRGPDRASRLVNVTRTDLLWAMVILDRQAILPKSVDTVAAHVGMRLMGTFAAATEQTKMATILNLFQEEANPPSSLTDWDKALVRELYAIRPKDHIDTQRRQIARNLVETASNPQR